MGGMRIAVTGSTGLIGTALVAALRSGGHQVVRLVRRTPASADEIAWDPLAAAGGLAPGALDGLDAVVHLAGANVASRRWTAAYKEEIRASRVQGTRALVSALAAAGRPPSVLLSGSAIGFYGDTGGREVDESSPPAPVSCPAWSPRGRPRHGGRRRPASAWSRCGPAW